MRWLNAALVLLVVVTVSLAASDYPALDRLANAEAGPIKINMPDASLFSVFDAVATVGGFKVVASPEWPRTKVSVVWDAPTVRDALVRLAREFDLDYASPSPHKLIVEFKER